MISPNIEQYVADMLNALHLTPEQRAWDAAMSDEGGEIPADEVKQPTPEKQ